MGMKISNHLTCLPSSPGRGCGHFYILADLCRAPSPMVIKVGLQESPLGANKHQLL